MVVRFDALPEYRPDYRMCSFIMLLYKSFHISNGMGIRKGGSWWSGDGDQGCQGLYFNVVYVYVYIVGRNLVTSFTLDETDDGY